MSLPLLPAVERAVEQFRAAGRLARVATAPGAPRAADFADAPYVTGRVHTAGIDSAAPV